MLAPPVAFAFAADTPDRPPASYDVPAVSDPPSAPAVIASVRLPPTPPATMHTTDVSDAQSVACAAVWPLRP